jgi:DNA-binding CsgD family transcriptional regulator
MKERVKTLLDAGRSRQSIARELGIDPSTVTRYARLAGVPDGRDKASLFDWAAIQAYYDAGHTIDECRVRFGFSYGAWDKAAVRGDLVPRPRAHRQLAHQTRDRVERLLADGLAQNAIAEALGISKSTVAYHCRKLGRRAEARFARRYEWSEVQRVIEEEGLSMTECLKRFGFCRATWREAVERGDIVPRPHAASMKELLVAGRHRQRGHLKGRLIRAGLKENRCETCGITDWRGEPLTMELHHVNGDGEDNRLENLMLLCANCHSQTDNWGGRGVGRRRAPRLAPDEQRARRR